MQKTKTRFFLERHSITIIRSAPNHAEAFCKTDFEKMTVDVPANNTHSVSGISALVTIPLGILIWFVGSFVVDLLVMRIFPVPADLFRHGSLKEIIASRPTTAVLLNVCGQLIVLGFATFAVTRFSRPGVRVGWIMTAAAMTVVVTNMLLTRNFRWPLFAGLVLLPLVGYVAIGLGNNDCGLE